MLSTPAWISPFEHSTLYPDDVMFVRVIKPSDRISTLEQLVETLSDNREEFMKTLQNEGAILIRGFPVKSAPDFEKVALAISPNMQEEYLGTSPRVVQPGCKYVFSASEFPWYIPIPQHCEISFTKHPPRTIAFCCLQPPTGGGQTPLCDFRQVYNQIRPELRDKWQSKGLRMLRSYGFGSWWQKFDPYAVKNWNQVFQTDSKEEIEKVCEREDYKFSWTKDNTLRLENIRPAYITHPETNVPVWFNHAHIFDNAMIPAEYGHVNRAIREKRWKSPISRVVFTFLKWFARSVLFVKSFFIRDEEHPTHVTFGDGTPIPKSELEEVRDVIWRNHRYCNWEAGDIMILDNFMISHGRTPFTGPRKVVVAWC